MPIEKTVFISYRRTNIYHARAMFQDLRANGYDVFMDYESIDSGAFDQIIINQIKARAHFIVILTPSALERCTDPNDWLRREIETAIDEKRNIIPLMFEGFDWKAVDKYLVGKMMVLNNYSSLRVPSDYFDEAMNRLRTRFLNVDVNIIIHPIPPTDAEIVAKKIQNVMNQLVMTNTQLSTIQYYERAYQHQMIGRYDEAIQDYTETIRLNPQHADAYNGRGLCYYHKGNYNHAIQDYTQAIQLNSKDALAYYNRGFAYQIGKKDYNHAIADCTEAIRLNPQFLDAYNIRGIAYFYKKDYDRAIADFNEGMPLQNASAYVLRGIAYENKKDYKSAIADYNRALEIDPNHQAARECRKSALQKKRDS